MSRATIHNLLACKGDTYEADNRIVMEYAFPDSLITGFKGEASGSA